MAATSKKRGSRSERRAALHYLLRGYRILGLNVWAGGNEIDVIARRGRALVFAEVKERAYDAFGAPEEFVHPEKQRRVRRAAEAWLAAHPELDGCEIRFDVVAVASGRLERLSGAF
jgi:putative endonuclease